MNLTADGQVSELMQRISAILTELNRRPAVKWAILSTEDGLAVGEIAVIGDRLAAVAGFLFAAARQSCALLACDSSDQIVVQTGNNFFLVCQSFSAREVRLILVIVFHRETAYRQLFTQTIRMIQRAMAGERDGYRR